MRDLEKFKAYLNKMSSPTSQTHGTPHFYSREVRDKAKAMVDALYMLDEGVPPELIKQLTDWDPRVVVDIFAQLGED